MSAVVDRAPPIRYGVKRRLFGTRQTRQGKAFYGYSLTTIALGIGWILREREFISAEHGVGYWLGIVGGSMMLLLLLYPLRKRIKVMRILGPTAKWFKLHMVLGILGPLLVIYHSNFNLGSFNSTVALICMLAVAGSGVVGRHIYARIHKGLYGNKTTLHELRRDLNSSLDQSQGLATFLPKFAAELDRLADEVQGDQITGDFGMLQSLAWSFRKYVVWIRLRRMALRELRVAAMTSSVVGADFPRFKAATCTYIRRFVRLSTKIAQFTLYEKLFAWWHVLHMPLFIMMIVSALVHVLAVHMY